VLGNEDLPVADIEALDTASILKLCRIATDQSAPGGSRIHEKGIQGNEMVEQTKEKKMIERKSIKYLCRSLPVLPY
jgi:hypothetical protein